MNLCQHGRPTSNEYGVRECLACQDLEEMSMVAKEVADYANLWLKDINDADSLEELEWLGTSLSALIRHNYAPFPSVAATVLEWARLVYAHRRDYGFGVVLTLQV